MRIIMFFVRGELFELFSALVDVDALVDELAVMGDALDGERVGGGAVVAGVEAEARVPCAVGREARRPVEGLSQVYAPWAGSRCRR